MSTALFSAQILFLLIGLAAGAGLGWLLGGRSDGRLQSERDVARAERAKFEDDFRAAIRDLEKALAERDQARIDLSALMAEQKVKDEAHAAQLRAVQEAKEALSAQFSEVGGKLLDEAQRQFLERADARFRQSEELAGQGIKALLQPVHERLQRYEEQVTKVEAERRDAFGLLQGQISAMREGTERVSSEAAKLVNALRNAPKARGRWGEQQLRNVLESCGLAEHADFVTEVSVSDGEGGRLRPDVIVRVPGGKSLVIDAKVSLNAYQDAFGAVDEQEREVQLAAHATAMKAHVNALGNKAYWSQFDDAPDYVIMFVPGEHFLTAALEQDHLLWDYAFDRKVLLATPTNLIAIARTVAAVWKQEKMAGQAREIAELGRELYGRLATMGGHVGRMGRNLDTAVSAYNAMVGSLESQVLTSAQRFEKLGIETGAKDIEALPVIETNARTLTKLGAPATDAAVD
ncbi:MAG: DNA recombination protein RmuC [Chakrabartia sp.]